jgi:phosphatidylglycerophosphatase A
MAERVSQIPTTPANSAPRKPRVALAIATALGLGYLPLAPGTWGSLAAVPLYFAVYFWFHFGQLSVGLAPLGASTAVAPSSFAVVSACTISVLMAAVGVWASSQAARFCGKKDPQFVVIDEVSGQHLTLLLGSLLPVRWSPLPEYSPFHPLGSVVAHSVLSWKFLLAGFILFRVFDIWKPFPARQAESLPGGWGIMADDWVAAVYAALGLWLLRALGL